MASLSVIESTSAIGCCSEVASTSSNEDVQVFNETMGNNNTQYHTQMGVESPFPRRESVNISFRNLKYTVNKFNFSKRQFGEYKCRWNTRILFNNDLGRKNFVTKKRSWAAGRKVTHSYEEEEGRFNALWSLDRPNRYKDQKKLNLYRLIIIRHCEVQDRFITEWAIMIPNS